MTTGYGTEPTPRRNIRPESGIDIVAECGDACRASTSSNRRRRVEPIVIGIMRLIKACAFVALIAANPFAAAEAKQPVDPQALLTHYKCYICHADRETKAGPAYVDVAAQYRKTPDAVSVIALEIRRGLRRGGPWHMPPHPEVSVAEARAMARYIVSLRP
jgi:cytochrome c